MLETCDVSTSFRGLQGLEAYQLLLMKTYERGRNVKGFEFHFDCVIWIYLARRVVRNCQIVRFA